MWLAAEVLRYVLVALAFEFYLVDCAARADGGFLKRQRRHAGRSSPPPLLGRTETSAEGIGETFRMAPYDELQAGVESHADEPHAVEYHPPRMDLYYPFPRESATDAEELVDHDRTLDPATPVRGLHLVCVSQPDAWRDSLGNDCATYGQRQWCTEYGTLGVGWPATSPSPASFALYGVSAMKACCECGGGLRSVVAAEHTKPLMDRNLVAGQDRIVSAPTSPKRPFLAPASNLPGHGFAVAPHDSIPADYSRHFHELYHEQARPSPSGFSARFYRNQPYGCSRTHDSLVITSSLERSLDYRAVQIFGISRRLQTPVLSMASSGGIYWGRWTGTIRIYKAGVYNFNLDIGFNTQSRLLIDGLELKTWGQCQVAKDTLDCSNLQCRWALPPGTCDNYGKTAEFRAEPGDMSSPEQIEAWVPELVVETTSTTTTVSVTDGSTTTTTTDPGCPRCADGLCLVPIAPSECPKSPHLPNCDKVGPGELCESDGECNAHTRVNNCRRFDVYRKALPSGQSAPVLNIGFTITNVNFDQMSTDGPAKEALAKVIKAVVNDALSSKVDDDQLHVAYSAGSVTVLATVMLAVGSDPKAIAASIDMTALQDQLSAKIPQAKGLLTYTTGTIGIVGLHLPDVAGNAAAAATATGGPAPAPAPLPAAVFGQGMGAVGGSEQFSSANLAPAPAPAPSLEQAPAAAPAAAPASGPAGAEVPQAQPQAQPSVPLARLGSKPGEMILAAGLHCIDATVRVNPDGQRLQMFYKGPDTDESDLIIPGQVLYCDDVIRACPRPELRACQYFREDCSHYVPPASMDVPPPLVATNSAQIPLAPAASPGPAPAPAPAAAPATMPAPASAGAAAGIASTLGSVIGQVTAPLGLVPPVR
eukprot:TRINITY_DN4442_c0_g4_i1.p1 TRINITY_DN4442_c0_g4~~TRINITY_DN4442_c0_g4_i1.p1  ORF type:complete len:891 (+),score=96.06 TRINITY_DN4442_c0_g4_i1:49-2673(+)